MSAFEDLKAENARLAVRVAELEAELAAKPVIDRLTLFRMADNAPWGILTLNAAGRIDYANPALACWMRRPPPALGEAASEAVSPALLARLDPAIAAGFRGKPSELEFELSNLAGSVRHLRALVQPRGDPPNGVVVTLYDVTESMAVDRAVRENEARLAHITAVTPSVLYIFDVQNWRPVWAAGRTEEVYGFTAETLVSGGRELAVGLIHPDDLPKITARLRELAAQPDGHVAEFEMRIARRDEGYRWILDRAVVFERALDGRIAKTLSAAIDIDERKRAEDRRKLLLNELNHRVKNTLAAVQSIARQTLRGGRAARPAVEEFTARLMALSAAHDVLTRENWRGAQLKEIVAGALAPFSIGEARVETTGHDVRLPARAALGLAMALHELATNALKYGALSDERGLVRIAWQVEPRGDARRLDLEWREVHGPPVLARARRGFGTRLLTEGLPTELDGATSLEFLPDGVVCRVSATLKDASAASLADSD